MEVAGAGSFWRNQEEMRLPGRSGGHDQLLDLRDLIKIRIRIKIEKQRHWRSFVSICGCPPPAEIWIAVLGIQDT